MEYTLVMTAAVDVKGMTGISAESVIGREDQYINTLKFYVMKKCVTDILFIDNSGWDLTRIKSAVASNKVTYLSFDENDYPRKWGKGYGEMLIMDHAVDFLRKKYGERMIVKVTGRFPVLNIDKMVREFSRRKNLVYSIDIIEHGLYRMLGLNWAASKSRTIIYAISTGFYMGNVYGRYRQIPSVYGGAEGLMRAVWDETRNQPGVYSRFKTEPRLSGVGGGEELCVAYS